MKMKAISVSSESDKSHTAKIEDYISKKYDEVALQHLKWEELKEINNECPCKSEVNSNESLLISLKEHIESLQSDFYFLREEIRQKTTLFQQYFKKISMLFPTFQNMTKSYQKIIKKTIAKQEANTAELENKVSEINNVTANLTKVADIAVPTNVSNLSSKNNSPSTIENIQHTHEPLPSIPSNTAENEEEVGSNTAKEQQENSQIENNRQVPQNKLAFTVGDSMSKDVDSYLLTGS